jgi:hypothetical protein
MPFIPSPAKAARNAASAYIQSKLEARIVSTAQATAAVRAALPNCPIADRELIDMIAATALENGLSVSFDCRADRISHEVLTGNRSRRRAERRNEIAD